MTDDPVDTLGNLIAALKGVSDLTCPNLDLQFHQRDHLTALLDVLIGQFEATLTGLAKTQRCHQCHGK